MCVAPVFMCFGVTIPRVRPWRPTSTLPDKVRWTNRWLPTDDPRNRYPNGFPGPFEDHTKPTSLGWQDHATSEWRRTRTPIQTHPDSYFSSGQPISRSSVLRIRFVGRFGGPVSQGTPTAVVLRTSTRVGKTTGAELNHTAGSC